MKKILAILLFSFLFAIQMGGTEKTVNIGNTPSVNIGNTPSVNANSYGVISDDTWRQVAVDSASRKGWCWW